MPPLSTLAMSVPPLRDLAARALSAVSDRAPAPRREFADLPVETAAVQVPTRHGDVACTVYRAPGAGADRAPVHVNVHGGGFVIRFAKQDDPWCRYLATHAGVTVVSVDYATAPRHRFPVAVEQVQDVVAWAAQADRDWDGSRLCVGGQSAGGSLAAAAARAALEQGGPAIALQVLHYPVLDLATPPQAKPKPAGDRNVPPMWMSVMFRGAYLPDPVDRIDRFASPVLEADADRLRGIAPALVVTAAQDRLRAEGAAYARTLHEAGSLVEHLEAPRVGHGYDILGQAPDVTRSMYERIAARVAAAVQPA